VNRLVAWWSRTRDARWFQRASQEQRAAIKRDLLLVMTIWREL